MKIIYIIKKNTDFVEAFMNKDEMITYLNSIPYGIYGWKPPKGKTFAEMAMGPENLHGGWCGYTVKEIEAE